MQLTKLGALVIAALFLAAPLPAGAAALWFGGEDTSMTADGTAIISAIGTEYNATYSRVALEAGNGTTVADPPANRWVSPAFSSTASIWVHAVFYVNTITTTSGEQALILRSPDGVGRVYLRQTGTSGVLKLSIANAARSFTDLVTLSAYSSLDSYHARYAGTIYLRRWRCNKHLLQYCSCGHIHRQFVHGCRSGTFRSRSGWGRQWCSRAVVAPRPIREPAGASFWSPRRTPAAWWSIPSSCKPPARRRHGRRTPWRT